MEHGFLQEERMAARMDEQVLRVEAAEAEAARAKGLLVESVAQLQEAQAERAQLQRRLELKDSLFIVDISVDRHVELLGRFWSPREALSRKRLVKLRQADSDVTLVYS